jgi:hypothetical protein
VAARAKKFKVGEVVITPPASAALDGSDQTLNELLARHQAADWGDVSQQMRTINARGLIEHFSLQSTYTLNSGQRLVVFTNGQRTLTMVHLDPMGR